jgi:glutamate-1-semialdehyde aminotransferase
MSYVTGSTSTYSKAAYLDLPDYPIDFISAEGCEVRAKPRDGQTRTYIDFTASLGAIILSYSVYKWGGNLLLPGPHESEEKAAEVIYFATGMGEVRWCKNGSDATEAAVRLARFVSKRHNIITNSYHGSHSDLVTATEGKDGGILPDAQQWLTRCTSPQSLLESILMSPSAAVLMEPVTPTCNDWRLEEVKAACQKAGTLLIFDEILTGFRSRYGSIAPSIHPDLACYGKAIGNGASIACVAGPRELMRHFERDVFMSGTYATDIPALVQCWRTLQDLYQQDYSLFEPYNDELSEALTGIAQGYSGRWQLQLHPDGHRKFVNALARRYVLVGRDFFLMFAHLDMDGNKWNQTLEAIQDAREECNL